MSKTYFVIFLVFALIAAVLYFFSWAGNSFYFEHGKRIATTEDLNRILLFDVITIGTPLFISGLFLGLAKRQTVGGTVQ